MSADMIYMTEDQAADLELIAEVQKGDKSAFDSLVLKYQYKVFKVVARYVSDPSEVLDVTQESFIKAYNALDKFRGDSSFYTWLYRIAVNTAKNYIISKGRRIPESDYDISDVEHFLPKSVSKEFATPEGVIICDEIEHVLYDIIDELPSDLRTAIILREIEGLTYDDISAVMDCPVGTVRSRIFRAREAIDKKLDPFIHVK